MPTSPSKRHRFDPAIGAKAQRMTDNLRRLHRLGQEANSDPKKLSTDEFAAAHGVNPHTMRKARAFARAYTQRDLDKLCRLRRPSGLPLHVGYLNYLLSIPEKRDREAMAHQAASEGWSAADLYAAIRRKCPQRRCDHGRRMSIPASPTAGLSRLAADADRWLRRSQLVLEKVRTARLDRDGRQIAKEAAEVLERLAAGAEDAARSLRAACGRRVGR